jgi:hypothetical protein
MKGRRDSERSFWYPVPGTWHRYRIPGTGFAPRAGYRAQRAHRACILTLLRRAKFHPYGLFPH